MFSERMALISYSFEMRDIKILEHDSVNRLKQSLEEASQGFNMLKQHFNILKSLKFNWLIYHIN